jgi:hypothetical protein
MSRVSLVSHDVHHGGKGHREIFVHLNDAAEIPAVPVERLPWLSYNGLVVDPLFRGEVDYLDRAAAERGADGFDRTRKHFSGHIGGIDPRVVTRAHVPAARQDLVEVLVTGAK